MRSAGSVSDSRLAWALVVAGTILMAANTCSGQDTPELPDVTQRCAPEIPEDAPRRATLIHNETTGLWINGVVVRCLLGRLAMLPEVFRYARLQESRQQLSGERDALADRQVNLAVQEAETAVEALEAAERGRRQAVEALGAWHRSRILWFIVGVVVTIGATVALVYAADRLRGDP